MQRTVVLVFVASCGFSGKSAGTSDATDTIIDASRDGGVDAAIDAMIDAPVDAAIDAPLPPDAFVFTPALCPVTYNLTTAAAPDSRYRVIGTAQPFATQHADCNDDTLGWTHLVVFDSQTEATAVGGMANGFRYVGLVQAPNQATVGAAWYRLTGGVLVTAWSNNSPQQPEDGEDYAEGNEENLAVASGSGALYDVRGLSSYIAVCECDGAAIDATVATYLP